jgi:hypothetical protein
MKNNLRSWIKIPFLDIIFINRLKPYPIGITFAGNHYTATKKGSYAKWWWRFYKYEKKNK